MSASEKSEPTPEKSEETFHEPLSQTLTELLAREHEQQSLTLGEITHRIGSRGFGLLFLILSLPSALPVPAPGYSTPFGALLALLALQLLAGRSTPWLPKSSLKISLHGKFLDSMLKFASAFFAKVEIFVKPRMKWAASGVFQRLAALLVLLMACLMILPIPFTNTFPAFVIFVIGIAMTEEDGLASLVALLLAIFATCLYTVVVFLLLHYGIEGVQQLVEQAKRFLGR